MYSALAGKYKGVTGSSACISSTNSASQNKDKYTKNTEPKNPQLTFRMKNLDALPEGAERQGRLPQEILQRASGSSDAWCKSDVSLGDLNGLQVHAHMQLAAMILFPNKELRNPPYNYEQLRLPNVALTANSDSNRDILFDVAQICRMYFNGFRGGKIKVENLPPENYKSLATILKESSSSMIIESRCYMDAQDCLRFLDSYKNPASRGYRMFVDEVIVSADHHVVDEIILSSDHNESSNEKECNEKECDEKESHKPARNKRYTTEARKQQMREYSKTSYYKNKAEKETQSVAQTNREISNAQFSATPPSYEASMNPKNLFPQQALVGAPKNLIPQQALVGAHVSNHVHPEPRNAHDEFMNTCSTIMQDVVLALDDCENETSKKRKRAQSVRNVATILLAANRFMLAASNES